MKAYEFSAQPTPEGKLELPEAISQVLPTNQTVRVILLIDETADSDEKTTQSQLTAKQFVDGHSEAEVAYDSL